MPVKRPRVEIKMLHLGRGHTIVIVKGNIYFFSVLVRGALAQHITILGEPRSIPGAEPGEIPIAWSADGRQLMVHRGRAIPASIFRVDIATGRKTPWKNLLPSDPTGVLTIAPIVITPDGKYYAYSFIRDLDALYLLQGIQPAK